MVRPRAANARSRAFDRSFGRSVDPNVVRDVRFPFDPRPRPIRSIDGDLRRSSQPEMDDAAPSPPATLTLPSPRPGPAIVSQARRDNSTRDEPFAWDSREFLRKRLVGRRIKFRVEYVVSSIGREFGTIYVGDENVSLASVSHGWARVRPSQGGDAAANYDELVDAEREAQTREAGLWTKDATKLAAATRSPPAPETVDNRTLLSTRRGVPTPAIVEAVLNGGLPPRVPSHGRARDETRDDHGQRRRRAVPGDGEKTETRRGGGRGRWNVNRRSCARTLRARGETLHPKCRLLHREVRVVFEGADKYDNLHATVLFAGKRRTRGRRRRARLRRPRESRGLVRRAHDRPDRGRAAAARGGEKSEGRAGEDLEDVHAAGVEHEVRSIHWSPYDRVGDVDADP